MCLNAHCIAYNLSHGQSQVNFGVNLGHVHNQFWCIRTQSLRFVCASKPGGAEGISLQDQHLNQGLCMQAGVEILWRGMPAPKVLCRCVLGSYSCQELMTVLLFQPWALELISVCLACAAVVQVAQGPSHLQP